MPQLKLGSDSSKRDRSLHLVKLSLLLPLRSQLRQKFISVIAKRHAPLVIATCAGVSLDMHRTLIETATA